MEVTFMFDNIEGKNGGCNNEHEKEISKLSSRQEYGHSKEPFPDRNENKQWSESPDRPYGHKEWYDSHNTDNGSNGD